MLTTTRLQSGFDVELHLGRGWLFTAIDLLQQEEVISLPFGIKVDNVFIIDDPDWDIELYVLGSAIAKATVDLNANGTELDITFDNPLIPNQNIPFGGLGDLADAPQLVKVIGDNDHENALAFLANINLRASPQNGAPLPEGEHLARGNAANVVPFLPINKDVAFGLGAATFPRFANHIWHDTLADDDGNHPLPDAENRAGDWDSVSMSANVGTMNLRVRGEVEADSPVIDIIPDPDVTFAAVIRPQLINGRLVFELTTDLDIDTGFWGDVLAFVAGGIIGFPLMLLTGGVINPVNLGIAAVIALEVTEEIVEGEVHRRIQAAGAEPILTCRNGIIQQAIPPASEQGISVGPLDAIPSNIPMHTDNGESLYKRFVGVTSNYDDLVMDPTGLAVCGTATINERFEPRVANLTAATYSENDELESLTYSVTIGNIAGSETLSLAEVLIRMAEGEVQPLVRPGVPLDDSTFRILEGKLAVVCLEPIAIHREASVVTHIKFENEVVLTVPDCVILQRAGAIILEDLQLIQPAEGNAYYRSRPDGDTNNNFESLPEFDLDD